MSQCLKQYGAAGVWRYEDTAQLPIIHLGIEGVMQDHVVGRGI